MADITTPAQFRMRRLIRGWKREAEERRAAEDKTLLRAMIERFEEQASKQTPLTSDNIRISSIRPWQPSDDEPDGAA